MSLSIRNLKTLKLWGELLYASDKRNWTKWDQNLLLILIDEIRERQRIRNIEYKKKLKNKV